MVAAYLRTVRKGIRVLGVILGWRKVDPRKLSRSLIHD